MKHKIRSKNSNIVYVFDDEADIENITIPEDLKITASMVKDKKDDLPHNVSRFSVTQVPDFSFSDGANIQAVKPQKRRRPRIKTVIENIKPEL